MRPRMLGIIGALLLSGVVRAEEGLWTLNGFPAAKLRAPYGFVPDQAWLDYVRLASVRLAGGCSGSFVSPNGLVMTNHHCAHSCIAQLSSAKHDRVKDGYHARTPAEELRCPEIEINQLVEITEVTTRMARATKGLEGKAFGDAQRAETARIEKGCATSPRLRCDVVTLYHGGAYHLYKYRRYQDVRLVFAPEFDIAFFGGDPDNFMFPRYDLDLSFLRVYENGQPLQSREHFSFSPAGAKEGELTFVTGHPGRTSRLLTVAALEYHRDIALPERLFRLAELRGQLIQFSRRSPEHKRIAGKDLFGVENAFKALKGRHEALRVHAFLDSKVQSEKALRAKVQRSPALRRLYGKAWDEIARSLGHLKTLRKAYSEIEGGLDGRLFRIARSLVRGPAELTKPNEQRLRDYRDSALPALKQDLFSQAPIYDELEVLKLTFALTKLRESLGVDHPLARRVLGRESPEELATRLVKGTRIKEVGVRQKLWNGGQKEVAASKDPMIELVRRIDPQARELRRRFEDEVEAVAKKNSELVARARFAVYGMDTYPDATFTLRLSYGQVKGYQEDSRTVAPITTVGGAFARHTGRPPFALPARWLQARDKLNPQTPLNFCTTNDIIGGNSGSPVVNKDRQIVGLIFDGNIQSLGGEYGFDPSVNRAVAVHSQGILEALEKVYGATRMVEELRAPARR